MRALLLAATLALSGAVPAATASPPRAIELRADEVTLRQRGRSLDARGGVRVTDGARRLSAERAVYSVPARHITLSGRVIVTTPQGILKAASATTILAPGKGLETIDAAGEVSLEAQQRIVRAKRLTFGPASGTISAEGGVEILVPPDISGRGDTLLMKSGEAATLRGRARIQTTDGAVEGDRIDFAERTEVAFVRGNVAGVFDKTRITSEAATFYGRERRAVFRGGVRVMTPGRTIQATTVTIFLADRRIVAEGETTIQLDDEPQRP